MVLSVILTILKIIGIVLLCIIGLVLLILLAALFVPIRYKVTCDKKDDMNAMLKVTYLLNLVRFKTAFSTEGSQGLSYSLKVLFFSLINSKSKKKKASKSTDNPDNSSEDLLLDNENGDASSLTENQTVVSSEDENMDSSGNESRTVFLEDYDENNIDYYKSSSSSDDNADSSLDADRPDKEFDAENKETTLTSQEREQMEEKLDEFMDDSVFFYRTPNPVLKIKFLFEKLAGLVTKLKTRLTDIASKASEKFENNKYTIQQLYDKIKGMIDKASRWKAFLTSRISKRALDKVILEVRNILNHIKPRKIRTDLDFGFEDVYNTGRLLAVLGFLYPKIPGALNVTPDFEDQHFNADILIKGHIRLISVLIPVLRILLNKDVKHTIKTFKKMK